MVILFYSLSYLHFMSQWLVGSFFSSIMIMGFYHVEEYSKPFELLLQILSLLVGGISAGLANCISITDFILVGLASILLHFDPDALLVLYLLALKKLVKIVVWTPPVTVWFGTEASSGTFLTSS
ncbi:hypothetical protein ACJX0J_039026, partial [Zea mays]